eukprot:XP_001694565.1 predicted protein [Chlamydomonas reinhardtii]
MFRNPTYLGCSIGGSLGGGRAACRMLRDVIDSHIDCVALRVWPRRLTDWRPGHASPLARFARCTTLHVNLRSSPALPHHMDDEVELEDDVHPALMPWPPLLATMCMYGVGANVASGVTSLHLFADLWGLPSLVSCAAVLSGRLTHIRELALLCWHRTSGDVGNPRAAYAALAAALPRLTTLLLPFNSWLPGCGALDGSGLTHLKVEPQCGPLLLEDARALTQIRQLTHIELGAHHWQQQGSQTQPGSPRRLSAWTREQGFPRDEADAATLSRLHPEHRLAPTSELADVVISFEGGAVVGVEVGRAEGEAAAGLDFLAAALLPRLAATRQAQLPFLKLGYVADRCRELLRYLTQPRRPLARLLALCERKELGVLRALQEVWDCRSLNGLSGGAEAALRRLAALAVQARRELVVQPPMREFMGL